MAKTFRTEVTFPGAGGTRLAGTLLFPVAAGAVPALVLLAGSGPTDRDGNQLPRVRTDVLAQFAGVLADAGVASLRYDKRGVGRSEPVPLGDPAKLADFAAWENFVGDAAAAVRWLRRQPGVLPGRVGFLGHSEGGLIALQASGDVAPAALVLASTPGRPMDAVLHDQIAALLKRQGASPEQARFYLDRNDAILAEVRRTGVVPGDVPPGLAALFPAYLGRYWQGILAADPARLAARFPGPVLVLQGQRDGQVLADKDAPALDAALRSRRPDDHTLTVVPNAGHPLKPLKTPGDAGLAGPLAPEAVRSLRGWAAAKLAGGGARPGK